MVGGHLAGAQHQVGGEITFRDLVESVDETRFEALFAHQAEVAVVQSEIKKPPAPLLKRTKSIDPDADNG